MGTDADQRGADPAAGAKDPFAQGYDLIMAGWASQAVRTLADLSIAEHLAAGSRTIDELASETSTHATAL